jgi:hypothetical protein
VKGSDDPKLVRGDGSTESNEALKQKKLSRQIGRVRNDPAFSDI